MALLLRSVDNWNLSRICFTMMGFSHAGSRLKGFSTNIVIRSFNATKLESMVFRMGLFDFLKNHATPEENVPDSLDALPEQEKKSEAFSERTASAAVYSSSGAERTPDTVMARDPRQESDVVDKELAAFLQEIDKLYPDKIIIGLSTDHKHLSDEAALLYQRLGFPDRNSFLAAYGYKVESQSSAGRGRPVTTDPSEVISILRSRYPSGAHCSSVQDLVAENPDLASKLKTLQNRSKELYGTTFQKYLIQEGLLASRAKKESSPKAPAVRPKAETRKPAARTTSKSERTFYYTYENGTATLTRWKENADTLDLSAPIPEGEIKRLRIKFPPHGVMGDRFFKIESIKLPASITEFPDLGRPFNKVRAIEIPARIRKLPEKAFYGWAALETVTLPAGLQAIKKQTFCGCRRLKVVILPKSLKEIDRRAFENCCELQDVSFPESLLRIEERAFMGCEKLERVDLPAQAVYAPNSFPKTTKVYLGGEEQTPPLVEVKLSSLSIRSENAAKNRAAVTNEQAVEVHKILYRYNPYFEVSTLDGDHIGFLSAAGVRSATNLTNLPLGQAWDAKLKLDQNGRITVCFRADPSTRDTRFPERTEKYSWNRDDFDLKQCPIRDAAFSVQMHAGLYTLTCAEDIYRQYDEFSSAFSEELAQRMVLKDLRSYESRCCDDPDDDFPNPFYDNQSSLTMLETIPLGTEFEVKLDTVYLNVPNGSRDSLRAGGAEEYAYPVPAFVLFHRGVRVANVPLVMINDDLPTSYSAFWAFWKWSKEPTLKPRAWLVNFYQSDALYETQPACTFSIGFFPGTEITDGTLDLKAAKEYFRSEEGDPICTVPQLMERFAQAYQINLSDLSPTGSSGLELRSPDGTIFTLPLGMFQIVEHPSSSNHYAKTKDQWLTIEQVHENINPPEPAEPYPYDLCESGEFTLFAIVAGTDYGTRREACLSLKYNDLLTLVREPQNQYDTNAIAVYTERGAFCGYIPAKMAKWISPVWDAGVIQVEKTIVTSLLEWENDPPRPSYVQLEINVVFRFDSNHYAVLRRTDESPIPFVVMSADSKDDGTLFLLDIYQKDAQLQKEGTAFCDEAFGPADEDANI